MPTNLAGHSISLRANYHSRGFELTSKATYPLRIVAACDQNDSARILGSRIFIDWDSGNHDSAIARADSMLRIGWIDAPALIYAKSSAEYLDRYDKQLIFLDRLFEDYGVITVRPGTSNPPRLDRHGPRDPQQQRLYEETRDQILQGIERAKQNQH
jgi:hypothetical protein